MPRPALFPLLLLALLAACSDSTEPSPTEPASLHVLAAPSAAYLARQLTAYPVVELRDAAGTPVRRGGVTVTVSISAGTLTGTTSAVTSSLGRATFDDLVIDGDEGTVELRFECCGLAPAIVPLVLELAEPTVEPVGSATLEGRAGYPLDPAARVRVLDGRGHPLAGAAVRFRAEDDFRPVDTTVATDANGEAGLSYVLSDVAGTYALTATHVASGQTAWFEVAATATGQWAIEDEGLVAAGEPGSVITLPSLRLATEDGVPVDGAHVLYSIREGAGVLSRDTVFTVGGEHEAVTLTLGPRGLTRVEISAPGYLPAAFGKRVHSVTGPITFSVPERCSAGCQPAAFEWSAEAAADLVIGVRDAVGPLQYYPVRFDIPLEAGLVWVGEDWWPYILESGAVLYTEFDGILPFNWSIPAAAGSYSITLSAPLMAEPWTFTATRP